MKTETERRAFCMKLSRLPAFLIPRLSCADFALAPRAACGTMSRRARTKQRLLAATIPPDILMPKLFHREELRRNAGRYTLGG
jgi:hypothetical protein